MNEPEPEDRPYEPPRPSDTSDSPSQNAWWVPLAPVFLLWTFLAPGVLGGCLQTPYRDPAPLSTDPTKPRLRDAWRAPHGLALGLYSKESSFDYGPSLKEIADTGANAVELVVQYYQEKVDSEVVGISHPGTPPWRQIAKTIEQAQEFGLDVHFMPILLLAEPGPDDWRGVIRPKSVANWHRSYRAWIVDLARRAQQAGVTAFCVGSEFNTRQGDRDEWLRTIGDVRQVFRGAITYSANWDSFTEVSFLDALDALGMTTYHPLAKDKNFEPTRDELINAWLPLRSELIRWQQQSKMPMFFTEVGYPSIDGAALYPWDYTRTDAAVDELEQFDCLYAFSKVWLGHPELQGVFFFVWWGPGGPLDKGYTPRGKKGIEVIEGWFRKNVARENSLPAEAEER